MFPCILIQLQAQAVRDMLYLHTISWLQICFDRGLQGIGDLLITTFPSGVCQQTEKKKHHKVIFIFGVIVRIKLALNPNPACAPSLYLIASPVTPTSPFLLFCPPSASFAGSSLHQTLLICQGGLVGFRRFSERHSFRAALSLCQALVRIVLLTVGLVLLPYSLSLSVSTTFFVILCFCPDYGGFSSVCHPSPFLQQGSCKEGGGHLSQGQFFGGGVLIRFSMDAQ